MNKIHIQTSAGELIDKITILEIKKEKMNYMQLSNVEIELKNLKNIIPYDQTIDLKYIKDLSEINLTLWDIEERLRIKESKKEFDQEFINLARSVYQENDIRASLKKEINYKYNSNIIEEKSYSDY